MINESFGFFSFKKQMRIDSIGPKNEIYIVMEESIDKKEELLPA